MAAELVAAWRETLVHVDLGGTNTADVSSLGKCYKLSFLNLGGCQSVQDIAALGTCGRLKTLHLDSTNVTDLSALGYFYRNPFGSDNPYDGQACNTLQDVAIQPAPVTDVSPLGACVRLCKVALDAAQWGQTNSHVLSQPGLEVVNHPCPVGAPPVPPP